MYANQAEENANKTVLLTGASGAIGGALLERLLADDSVAQVFATSTRAVCSTHDRVHWLQLDYSNAASIDAAAQLLIDRLDTIEHFICASGYLHGAYGQPEKKAASLQLANMEAAFRLNAAGPLELFARCAPLLKAANAPRALFTRVKRPICTAAISAERIYLLLKGLGEAHNGVFVTAEGTALPW